MGLKSGFRLAAAALAVLVLDACAKPLPEPVAVDSRVERPAIGLALASTPEPFALASEAADRIDLTAPGPARLSIVIGPEQRAGINLIDHIKERKSWFEQAEGGSYLGNRELMTQIGSAFTARGTYAAPEGAVEETWVYAIHPSANRLLTVTYTYPTDESQERVQQLIAALGEIEGIGFPES
jgi:hypothetical protein